MPSPINGADVLAQTLANVGVDTIFCITGAGNLAIIDAIVRLGKTRLIYSHHEQAAVMEAQGFSRVSGNLGVALVTTGGGAANTITGVLSAYFDSVPVLLISGNESSFHCENEHNLRAYGVQGFDAVSVLRPITKSSIRINNVDEIGTQALGQIAIALSGRKGPVHIDFPMDLQRKAAIHDKNSEYKLYETNIASEVTESFVNRTLNYLQKSSKPIIYIGNGCRQSESFSELLNFAEIHKIPIVLSWSAIDLLPEKSEVNAGRVGIYGDRATNILIQQSDFLLCLGTRLAIPQVGYDKKDFARNASKWIVDIDATECSKFENLDWNVLCENAETVMKVFLSKSREKNHTIQVFSGWISEVHSIRKTLPREAQVGLKPLAASGFIHSVDVISSLNKLLEIDAIVVTDVGAGLLSGHYAFEATGLNRLITSQGLGEMGFGLPCAIGAFFADPKKQLVCLNTDGAIMFNLQELQLIRELKIPIKLFIFNNNGYSMIKISQENLFDSGLHGSSIESGISFPSFSAVAETFSLNFIQISDSSLMLNQLEKGLNSQEPVLFEIMMDPDQKYLPRLSTEKLSDGTLISPPIEDLDPKIAINDLEKYLGYKASSSSYKARNL